MLSMHNGKIEFLGYGVYLGEEIPPKDVAGYNPPHLAHMLNPKIQLDNGDVVWGCECYWDGEEEFKRLLARAVEVKTVSIHDLRKRSLENTNKENQK